jgi:hypothetical protein
MSRGVDREPCPYRIIDDAGNAFVFGKYCINVTNLNLIFVKDLLVVEFGISSGVLEMRLRERCSE